MTAEPFVPESRDLDVLEAASKGCKGCPLWRTGTQTVFGEGPAKARIMMVGEQPGDQEDLAGKPFVGPAGKLLDKAMAEACIPRGQVYVTNAVKHFKWVQSGARRLHAKPLRREVVACKPWLEAEIEALHPEKILLLGSTAAQSLLGPAFKITQERGKVISGLAFAPVVMATYHPSAVLRMRTSEEREAAFRALVEDLVALREADARKSAA